MKVLSGDEGFQVLNCFQRSLPCQHFVCLKDGMAKAQHNLSLLRSKLSRQCKTCERPEGA